MLRKILVLLTCVLCAVTVMAQDDNIVASDLVHPRGISYDSDGTLYIAETGIGGDFDMGLNQFDAPINLGSSGQITTVTSDGTQSVLIPGLPSLGGGEPLGVQRVVATDTSLWLVFSEGAPTLPMPFSWSVIELDRDTLRIKNFIDTYTYELENNPDGTDEVYDNPHDVDIAPDGTVYITDTGGNTIYTWTEDDGLQVFKTWNDNPVPSALSFAEDGTFWLAFLGRELAAGAGSVVHMSAEGEVLETYDGLTAVTDVLVADDGTVYFVELFLPGETPETPGPGAVSAIADGAVTLVAGGLEFPFGLAEAPDGSVVVSVGAVSFSTELIPGSVVRVVDAN